MNTDKIKCVNCGKLASAESRKCPHCDDLLIEPLQRPEHKKVSCPRCSSSADIIDLAGVQVDLCCRCRGIWFDKGEIQIMESNLSDQVVGEQTRVLLQSLNRQGALPQDKFYLKCPVCTFLMNRKTYLSSSGIMLYRCNDHGTWLDNNEAIRFVQLIVKGGEEKLRELVEKQRKRRERELDLRLGRLESEQSMQRTELRINTFNDRLHLVLDLFGFL